MISRITPTWPRSITGALDALGDDALARWHLHVPTDD
jgi:hypothetical protein